MEMQIHMTTVRGYLAVLFLVVVAASSVRAADCNTNGVEDTIDIATNASQDCDVNGVPDECQPDTDGDGLIDACDDCGQQLTDNDKVEEWSTRARSTSRGKVIWADNDESIHYFDGNQSLLIQAKDPNVASLGDVESFVLALGTGASGGEVVGGWRRGTDFAWVWSNNGNPPRLANATNPYDINTPLNPEGIAAADGCVFMILQAFDPDTNNLIRHVYKIDPANGNSALLTGDFLADVEDDAGGVFVTSLFTDGCKAAWVWCSEGENGSCIDPATQLHYYDGSPPSESGNVAVIDDADAVYGFADGRLIYSKSIAGVRQLFLYDTNLPAPMPVQLTNQSAADKQILFAEFDGRHLVMLRGNGGAQERELMLWGGTVITSGSLQPTNQPKNFNFPFQLNRGQLLWETAAGSVAVFDGQSLGTICDAGWLADGFIAQLRRSDATGADVEVFLKALTPPNDAEQPSPPWVVQATPSANGEVTLTWEAILGFTSYTVYYAGQSGITKANYAALGGGRVSGIGANQAVITGLGGIAPTYFVVTVSEGSTEGPVSMEVSAVACVDAAADADFDGTPDCSEVVTNNGPGSNGSNETPSIGTLPTLGTACGTCGAGAPLMMMLSMVGMLQMARKRGRSNAKSKSAAGTQGSRDTRVSPASHIHNSYNSILPGALRTIFSVILLAAAFTSGGATSCNPQPCTPEHPDYDEVTGLCIPEVVGTENLGPPGPGTGGLPTEPGTSAQDSSNLPEGYVDLVVYGLNGKWVDNGRKVCIIHTGSGVQAWYINPYVCDHADGTGATSQTEVNFNAQIVGNQLTGTTTTCVYGFDESSGNINGITTSDMTATVSEDGKTISGTWRNAIDNTDVPFSLTRETVGNCQP